MRIYSLNQGKELVRAAHNAIELYLKNPFFKKELIEDSLSGFNDKHGVFVTVNYYPTDALRGCVGFPYPSMPIKRALIDAAIAAAFDDPRFVPLSHRELDEITVEVSVLSDPVEVKGTARQRLKSIVVGRDGTIIEYGMYSGLLLPIVAVQEGWNAKQLLEQTCLKAGIPEEYWMQPKVKLYKYAAQVFRESEPNGPIIEVKLPEESKFRKPGK